MNHHLRAIVLTCTQALALYPLLLFVKANINTVKQVMARSGYKYGFVPMDQHGYIHF